MEAIDESKDELDGLRVKLDIEAITGSQVSSTLKIEDAKPDESINTLTPSSAPEIKAEAASALSSVDTAEGVSVAEKEDVSSKAKTSSEDNSMETIDKSKDELDIEAPTDSQVDPTLKTEDTKPDESISTLTSSSAPEIETEAASTLSSAGTAEDVSVAGKEDVSSKAKTNSAAKDSIYSKASDSKSKLRSKQKILAKRAEAKARAEQESSDRERERRKQRSKQKASRAYLPTRSPTETENIGKSGAVKLTQFYLTSAGKTSLIAAVSVSVIVLMLLRLRR